MVNSNEAEPGADRYLRFRVRKQPWWVWLLRTIWVLWLAAWLEFATGSWQEKEQTALSIAVEVLIVSVLLGLVLYFWRLRQARAG